MLAPGGKENLIDRIYTIRTVIALGNKKKTDSKISNGNSLLDYGCGKLVTS